MSEWNFSPEERARRAEVMRQRHKDPAFAKRRDERIRQFNKSPEQAARTAERMRKFWATFKATNVA